MTVNEAIEKITSAKAGETVYIKISKSLLTGDALTDLAALLGYTTTTTEIAEGIYSIDNGKDGIAYINFSYENTSVEIDIEVTSDNSEVKLTDIGWTWKYDGNKPSVDWGDGKGAIEIKNLEHISNIYATAGKYTIRITDLCISDTHSESAGTTTPFSNRATYMPATNIRFNKEQIINSAYSLFRNFRTLESISGVVRINPASSITSFQELFRNCYKLKDISKFTIIANNPSTGVSFKCMFRYCQSITAEDVEKFVITNLNLDSVTDYTAMFEYCTSLKRTPKNLIGPNCTNADYIFNASGVEYWADKIFDNVERIGHTFKSVDLKFVSTELKLDKLKYVFDSLADASLNYKSVETIHNALPVAPQEISGDDYKIVFGIDETEKNIVKNIQKLFGINPDDFSQWVSQKDGSLVTDGSGEPIRLPLGASWSFTSSKGWLIGFTSNSYRW